MLIVFHQQNYKLKEKQNLIGVAFCFFFVLQKFFTVHSMYKQKFQSKVSTQEYTVFIYVSYKCIRNASVYIVSFSKKKNIFFFVRWFVLFLFFWIAIACSQNSIVTTSSSSVFWWLLALLIATIMLVVRSCRASSHAFQSYNACQTNVKYYCSTSLWNRQIFIQLMMYSRLFSRSSSLSPFVCLFHLIHFKQWYMLCNALWLPFDHRN